MCEWSALWPESWREREAVILSATGDAASLGDPSTLMLLLPQTADVSPLPPFLPPHSQHTLSPTHQVGLGRTANGSPILPTPLRPPHPTLHSPSTLPLPILHPPGWPWTATGSLSEPVMWPECICTCALQPYRWWRAGGRIDTLHSFLQSKYPHEPPLAMFGLGKVGRQAGSRQGGRPWSPGGSIPNPAALPLSPLLKPLWPQRYNHLQRLLTTYPPQIGSQHPRCDALPPAVCRHHHTGEGGGGSEGEERRRFTGGHGCL